MKALKIVKPFSLLDRKLKVLNDLQRARQVNKWARVGRKVDTHA